MLAVLLLISLGVSFDAILPLTAGGVVVIVFAWIVLPGVIIARRVYASQRNPWLPALLVGTPWGFAFSSVVLMGLWLVGIRNPVALAFSPLVALLAAIPAGRLARVVAAPVFDRRDLAPIVLVLALVPLVNGRPFARVGEMRPEGKAYRAYFIADFEWAISVAAELSKGEVPPQNPFLTGDNLHYYWLTDLPSAVEYRAARHRLSIDQILLANTLLLDLGWVALLYFFVRHFVHSPPAAATACVAVVHFSSFEGIQQIYHYWNRMPDHTPTTLLTFFRGRNIDAISNWDFGSLKVDGLHRLLLYQRQHATAWSISLSSLLVLIAAKENGKFGINLFAGTLLALSLLVSSFIAVMVGSVVAIYQGLTLALRGRWRDLFVAGIAGGIPVGLAVLLSSWLQYVDRSGGPIVYVQRNPVAFTNPLTGIVLSFGPALIAAAIGVIVALWRRETRLSVVGLIIAVGFFFYFFVDVVDHQHAYVGWRAGHLLFMAFAPLIGFAWQELWAAGRVARVATLAGALLLAVAAAPMTIIDLYNTQDTSYREHGPGFYWTEILAPDELQALEWVKTYTPTDALVQVDPVRESGTWAYMPAFGERRMTAGMPISMIPLQKYKDASDRVAKVFTATSKDDAYRLAHELKLQYMFVGPRERAAYPHLGQILDEAPYWFNPVFRNDSVTIYRVT